MLMHGKPDKLTCEPSLRFSIVHAVEEAIARRVASLERHRHAIDDACSGKVLVMELEEQS